jgi:trimeric autotransporter adhesin
MVQVQRNPLRLEALETREMPALFAVGAGEGGGPRVSAYNDSGALVYNFFAYDSSRRDGVRVATGDVNGDGAEDIIAASGNQSAPQVRVFSGAGSVGFQTPALLVTYNLPANFSGGMQVAAGDVTGDGRADILLSTAGGQVYALDTTTGALSLRANLTNFGTAWSVGAADLNADGRADILIGTPSAAATATDVFGVSGLNGSLLYTAAFNGISGRVNLAGGRLDANGFGDIVYGLSDGANNYVVTHTNPALGTALRTIAVNPYGDWRGELRVGLDTRFGQPNIVLGPGFGGGPRVVQLDVNGNRLAGDFFAFEDTFRGGLYVG